MNDFEDMATKMKILKSKTSFQRDAYVFLMEALSFTVSQLPTPRHITGLELLEGIRNYARNQYGKMAKTVLNHWKIFTTDDFGRMVFDLVDVGILKKQPEDKIEDFHAIYNFDTAFLHPDQFADNS